MFNLGYQATAYLKDNALRFTQLSAVLFHDITQLWYKVNSFVVTSLPYH